MAQQGQPLSQPEREFIRARAAEQQQRLQVDNPAEYQALVRAARHHAKNSPDAELQQYKSTRNDMRRKAMRSGLITAGLFVAGTVFPPAALYLALGGLGTAAYGAANLRGMRNQDVLIRDKVNILNETSLTRAFYNNWHSTNASHAYQSMRVAQRSERASSKQHDFTAQAKEILTNARNAPDHAATEQSAHRQAPQPMPAAKNSQIALSGSAQDYELGKSGQQVPVPNGNPFKGAVFYTEMQDNRLIAPIANDQRLMTRIQNLPVETVAQYYDEVHGLLENKNHRSDSKVDRQAALNTYVQLTKQTSAQKSGSLAERRAKALGIINEAMKKAGCDIIEQNINIDGKPVTVATALPRTKAQIALMHDLREAAEKLNPGLKINKNAGNVNFADIYQAALHHTLRMEHTNADGLLDEIALKRTQRFTAKAAAQHGDNPYYKLLDNAAQILAHKPQKETAAATTQAEVPPPVSDKIIAVAASHWHSRSA